MISPAAAAVFWALAATATALLPMRFQIVPGLALLLSAPALIVWIGYEYGWFWTIPAFLAFASMFRNPLIYFWRKARGLPVTRPGDAERRQ